MSAYDKNFSDNIYGEENDKRYVTEARLNRMLDHEMKLLEDRILQMKIQIKCFLHMQIQLQQLILPKNLKHGWMGIRCSKQIQMIVIVK